MDKEMIAAEMGISLYCEKCGLLKSCCICGVDFDYEAEIAALKAENERLKSILEAKVLYGCNKKKNKVDKITNIKIEFHGKILEEIEGKNVKCGTWCDYTRDFGDIIFLTKEEAETKLKEKL